MDILEMSPRRPYIFRAMFDWIVDNELTPYVVVDTTAYGVIVPTEFIQDDKIVLNIAPHSVGQYLANNDQIEFNARFGGIPHHIVIPMSSIEAIYARENGAGLSFEPELFYEKSKEELKKPVSPFKIVK